MRVSKSPVRNGSCWPIPSIARSTSLPQARAPFKSRDHKPKPPAWAAISINARFSPRSLSARRRRIRFSTKPVIKTDCSEIISSAPASCQWYCAQRDGSLNCKPTGASAPHALTSAALTKMAHSAMNHARRAGDCLKLCLSRTRFTIAWSLRTDTATINPCAPYPRDKTAHR